MRCSPVRRARRARAHLRALVSGVRVSVVPRGVVLLGVVVLCLAVSPIVAFGAPTDPADADRAVADAQRRADRAADAYFDALENGYVLDREIGRIQTEVEQLDSEVARLRKIAVERAVDAYKRAGSDLTDTFGDQALPQEAIRRSVLSGVVNSHDRQAAAELRQARDDRDRAQAELRAARADQADTIEQLREEEARLNDLLVKAQNERRVLAEQQAAAAAAAAAAATAATTPSTTPANSPGSPAPAGATTTTGSGSSAGPAAEKPAPTPAPPPADYVPSSGTHPRHNDPFLVCTRQRESSGNYQAYNPAGPFYGAYQFLQSTWNSTANHAGRGDLVGLDPRRASAYDQDDMAWTLYQWRGKAPWNGFC